MNQELIDYLLDTFDFEAVHRCMVVLNWTWATCENEVPTIAHLRREARKQLLFVTEPSNEAASVTSGGLTAYRQSNGKLHLAFEVAHSSEFDYLEEIDFKAGRAALAQRESDAS